MFHKYYGHEALHNFLSQGLLRLGISPLLSSFIFFFGGGEDMWMGTQGFHPWIGISLWGLMSKILTLPRFH